MNRTPVKIRAIYADTDAMGIVYHTNYIRWFEVGRTELFREMGILYADVEAAGFHLPLTLVYCHYHLTCLIWDENRKNMLTEGYTVHACTDRCGKIVRIPAIIADKIRSFYPKIEGAKANP